MVINHQSEQFRLPEWQNETDYTESSSLDKKRLEQVSYEWTVVKRQKEDDNWASHMTEKNTAVPNTCVEWKNQVKMGQIQTNRFNMTKAVTSKKGVKLTVN